MQAGSSVDSALGSRIRRGRPLTKVGSGEVDDTWLLAARRFSPDELPAALFSGAG